jgi:DNA-binding HxlR family transcriptional regulator
MTGGPRSGMSQSGLRVDNLVENVKLQDFKKDIEKVIKNIPTLSNQVGVVIIDTRGIIGLESFDHPDSWKAIAKDVYKRYANDLAQKYESPIMRIDEGKLLNEIASLLKEISQAEGKIVFTDKIASTFAVNTKSHLAEYTELDGKLIHIVVLRKEKEDEQAYTPSRQFEPMPFRPRRPLRLQRQTGEVWRTANLYQPNQISTYDSQEIWRRKGTGTILLSLSEGTESWSALRKDKRLSSLSPNTLSSGLKALQSSGLVTRDINTRKYKPTAYGKKMMARF